MTTEDPILDELHSVRKRLLADAGGTLVGLVAQIQADQQKSEREVRTSVDNKSAHAEPRITREQVDG